MAEDMNAPAEETSQMPEPEPVPSDVVTPEERPEGGPIPQEPPPQRHWLLNVTDSHPHAPMHQVHVTGR